MIDVLNFQTATDDEIIDQYLEFDKKILCMICLTEEEQNYFDALFNEIERRNINGKVDARRNN